MVVPCSEDNIKIFVSTEAPTDTTTAATGTERTTHVINNYSQQTNRDNTATTTPASNNNSPQTNDENISPTAHPGASMYSNPANSPSTQFSMTNPSQGDQTTTTYHQPSVSQPAVATSVQSNPTTELQPVTTTVQQTTTTAVVTSPSYPQLYIG